MKTMTLYPPSTLQNALSDFDHRYIGSVFGNSVMEPATRTFYNRPAVDIRETDKAYLLDMELPGCGENDITIHVDGNSLTVASKPEDTAASAEPKEKKEGQEIWILRERRICSFSRSFKLPENANLEDVSAEFKNGVLSIEVQKRPDAQKRTIQIIAK
jgi:HSP20 family protein